jgi:hypothetical protein
MNAWKKPFNHEESDISVLKAFKDRVKILPVGNVTGYKLKLQGIQASVL